jgi:hypothetical protein
MSCCLKCLYVQRQEEGLASPLSASRLDVFLTVPMPYREKENQIIPQASSMRPYFTPLDTPSCKPLLSVLCISVFRREVALVRWSVGPLVRWSVGPLPVGPLVRWSVGWSTYHFEN